MLKVMTVHKFLITTILFGILGCSSQTAVSVQEKDDHYKIIEKGNYGNSSLYLRTLSYKELPANYFFTYEMLNKK